MQDMMKTKISFHIVKHIEIAFNYYWGFSTQEIYNSNLTQIKSDFIETIQNYHFIQYMKIH